MVNYLMRNKLIVGSCRDRIRNIDLPNCLETTNARLFADDTTLLATGINTVEVEEKLNNDLLNMDQWLKANKFTLNEGKTEFMIIGSRQ